MIILYCNNRVYPWIDPYYIADRLACNESEWMVPGTFVDVVNTSKQFQADVEKFKK